MSREIKKVADKIETHEGFRGTGHRLRFVCGFCRIFRCRSRRARTKHARHCKA